MSAGSLKKKSEGVHILAAPSKKIWSPEQKLSILMGKGGADKKNGTSGIYMYFSELVPFRV